GGYEQLAVDASPATTDIVDTTDTTTVSLGATGQITEAGGTVTYTATVDNAPASDLEITLSNGETITIEAGETSGTVDVTVAADEDAIADATSMSATITGTDGGGYEQLAVDASPATTDIVDTTDTTTVSLGATGQITEAGGTVTYTATVDNAPASDLEITLSNGETITIEAGETSGTVDVTVAADEDAIADATSMSANITGTDGGGYEQLAVDATPATTDIVDTTDTTTVSLGATGQITEAGGTVTYTATVDNAPASDLTVTLSNGETITIEAGETSGTVDVTVAADEDAIADATSMSATITGTDGGGYEQLAVDATPATTDIVDTTDTTTVSLGATGQITEAGGTVTYTATVDNAPASDLEITLSNGETITIEAGETSGTVDVTVAADEDAIADATSMSATITGTDGGGYEQLAVYATPATTDIVDTTDTTTVSLGATGQITEAGGTVTYTATVDNAPASDLTITLSNGETVTIEAGETSGTVDVTVAADEDAIADATSMSATITGTDGGGYEQLAVDATPATTDIVDTTDTTTVSLGATGQITEAGGTVTYTATVDNAPASDLEITLSNGETITIEAGETSGTVDVTVAADEDAIADATSMSATITGTDGGGYEQLAVDATPATTDIVDTTDTTTVSLGATGQITEAGGTVTYTATVDNAPASDLEITLSNGETITIEAGETSGTVDVTVAADEDAIADATSMSATITGTDGGGYEQLAVDASPATTDIVDTTDTTTVSLGATGQITEAGGTVTYTATVDNAPASDLTISLSNGETITIEAGETSGTVDVTVAADEDAIADATSMSATITGTDGGGYEQLAVDASPATTDIIDTTDTTTVSLGATGQITEAGGTVTYTATVDNAPASDLEITLSNGETITIEAGETSGTVDVTVAADEDAIADASSMSATITGTDGGGYEQLAVDASPATTDIVDTTDTTTVSLGATGQITEAGGTVTYTATVDNAPASDLEITLSNGETITIEAGETSGTVDVTVAADEDAIADATSMSATITGTDGGGYEQLAVDASPATTDIVDTTDTTTVSLGATGQITEAGGTVTYTATVDNAPASDLEITLSNGETITIEAGETSGTVDVTVAADEDAIADATSMSATITGTDGGGYEQLAVDATPATTDIVDTTDTTTVSLGATGQITEAGGTVTYTATVDNAPASDLEITLSNGETITIEAGETSGTVDVTVAADEDAIADATSMSATITGTDGGGYEQLAVDATPATTDIVDTTDTTTVSLGATGQITEAGGTVTYTATVDNAPASDLTVTLSNGETITIEAGKTSGNVDVSVSADDVTDVSSLSVSISDTSGGGYEQLAVSAASATTEVVDLNEAPVAVDDTGSGSAGDVLVSEDFSGGVSGWGDEVSARGGRMEIGKDETASKTFDFGAEHAGETVTVSFDSQTLGSWDESGRHQDFFTVDVNGSEVINTSEKGSESHSFQATLDESGQLTLELHTDSTASSERVRIDDLQIVSGDDWSGAATTVETSTISIDVLANDTDADGDTLTITDVSEVVDADGNVIGTAEVVDGKVEFTANAEYEGLKDGESVQGSFTYTISDGHGGADTATASVTVLGENDAVTDIVLSGTSVDEGAEAGTVVATLQSIDQDSGETFSYELTVDASGHFEIVGDKLMVKEGADIDYESANSHDLTIKVTDSGGNTYTETVTINVSDLPEPDMSLSFSVSLGDAAEITNGDDFGVSSTTSGTQGDPQVAALDDGGYVVVWEGKGSGDSKGIFAQRYDADGNEVGGEERINDTTSNTQSDPQVTGLSDGGFAITWTSKNQDGNKEAVIAKTFDADGNDTSSEIQVNQYTKGEQEQPDIASLEDGGFVIVWETDKQDGSGEAVMGRTFDADGTPQNDEFIVNTYSSGDQDDATVTGLADGGFVVAWESKNQDGDDRGVFAQRFDSDANKAGSEFQVNTETDEDQHEPSITGLANGGFVAVWTSEDQDGSKEGVFGQVYDADGNKVGGELQLNQYESKDQDTPEVSALSDGGFVVVWESKDQDGSNEGVVAREFDADGSPAGDEFVVNQYTSGSQEDPSVAVLDDGSYIVAWDGKGSGDSKGVFARQMGGDDSRDLSIEVEQGEGLAGGDTSVTVSNLPEGSSLSAGSEVDGVWTVSADELDGLKLTDAPSDEVITLDFDVTVTKGGEEVTTSGQLIHGTDGSESLTTSEGSDVVYGGEGSDTMVVEPFGGSDYFSGGEGGGWTDVIQLNADGVPAGSDPDTPWTIEVDGEQVQYDIADHALSLDPDASGVITFSDGSELTFDGVERIEW
ncbi:MAG: immunoglobulin-like domain-containing protein, partial [Sedimenticola sp.]